MFAVTNNLVPFPSPHARYYQTRIETNCLKLCVRVFQREDTVMTVTGTFGDNVPVYTIHYSRFGRDCGAGRLLRLTRTSPAIEKLLVESH